MVLKATDRYGSKRLGVRRPRLELARAAHNPNGYEEPVEPTPPAERFGNACLCTEPIPGDEEPYYPGVAFAARFYTHTLGMKEYEITNHLGNVLATVLDRKTGVKASATATTYAYFKADVTTAQDYYPFGSLMPGRTYVAPANAAYRFGFNGQQRDDEIAGPGNSMSAEYWQYDSRLGRRWNVDPRFKGFESVYSAFSNNPIYFTDVLGDTEDQRKKAVERAKEYKDKNPGKSYKYGGTGDPGEGVDCSGLVLNCIQTAGGNNPNQGTSSRRTTNIRNNTEFFTDLDRLEEGNGIFIDFDGEGGTGHTGIITQVNRNGKGQVTGYKFIHSGSTNGPTEDEVKVGKKSYYSERVTGFYKWDDPEPTLQTANNVEVAEKIAYFNPVIKESLVLPKQPDLVFKQREEKFSERLQNTGPAIVRDFGALLEILGF